MGLVYRRVVKFGPLRLHLSRRGISSWSIKLGPWSWNSRAKAHRVDLPGPFSWRGRRR